MSNGWQQAAHQWSKGSIDQTKGKIEEVLAHLNNKAMQANVKTGSNLSKGTGYGRLRTTAVAFDAAAVV